MNKFVWGLSAVPVFLAVLPGTTNYKLNSYGFGSGGTAGSSTGTYALEGVSGEVSAQTSSTSTYRIKPGFIETQQAHLPQLATFDNPSNYYNKLHFVINEAGNPSDAKYALAISTDNFLTDKRFVKSDLTVGNTLALTDYQTFTTWQATGGKIIGLLPSTTYSLKVKATQGKFTESIFGPVSSVATVGPQISFALSTDSQAVPPLSINFGSLLAATVVNSPDHINVSFATNAETGGNVYIYGLNNGLKSNLANYTIASATVDLAIPAEGFGAQSTSATQTSGGPLAANAPYNVTGNNVGLTDNAVRLMYNTPGPLVGGAASMLLKAKSSLNTPASTDYKEILTIIAAVSF